MEVIMLIKLKTKILSLILIIGFLLVGFIFYMSMRSDSSEDLHRMDILDCMETGLENKQIKELYKQDIADVLTLTDSKVILIDYFDVDLNEDGYIDKIVTIRSPLHSSSGGDRLDFLIGNKSGGYTKISNLTIQLYDQFGSNDASLYISDNKTNGYYDIIISKDENTKELSFAEGKYQ